MAPLLDLIVAVALSVTAFATFLIDPINAQTCEHADARALSAIIDQARSAAQDGSGATIVLASPNRVAIYAGEPQTPGQLTLLTTVQLFDSLQLGFANVDALFVDPGGTIRQHTVGSGGWSARTPLQGSTDPPNPCSGTMTVLFTGNDGSTYSTSVDCVTGTTPTTITSS